MVNKITITSIIALGLLLSPSLAFADEEYVPPPEASEGAGGWALIDPASGEVRGGIVCTMEVCGPGGSFNGVIGSEYPGCENVCIIRFQSRASEDGNVVGISSGASWDGDRLGTYTITEIYPEGPVRKTKLVPSKTFSDGKRFETGYVDINTRANVGNNENYFRVDVGRKGLDDLDEKTNILYLHNNQQKKLFSYLSTQEAVENFESNILEYIGEIESGEQVVSETINVADITRAIREIADQVMIVFKYFFGIGLGFEMGPEDV